MEYVTAISASFTPAADSSLSLVRRIPDVLSLESCIEAFSESETLDERNPWYCPQCRRSQCATKTLTVWRLPDFLIVYLKRFIYMNTSALKLEKPVDFQLSGLDLAPFLSGPLVQAEETAKYDLYAVVNHFGSVGGGHYTAYARYAIKCSTYVKNKGGLNRRVLFGFRHAPESQWNYFDDCVVTENKVPGDDRGDQASAYVLFYQRQGIHELTVSWDRDNTYACVSFPGLDVVGSFPSQSGARRPCPSPEKILDLGGGGEDVKQEEDSASVVPHPPLVSPASKP